MPAASIDEVLGLFEGWGTQRYDETVTQMHHALQTAALARADGRALALDGQWGFLRDFASSLPPRPNWSVPDVSGHWDAGRGTFGDAGFDAVWITPTNFIQYQAPDAPYDYDNAANESPMGAILKVVEQYPICFRTTCRAWLPSVASTSPLRACCC